MSLALLGSHPFYSPVNGDNEDVFTVLSFVPSFYVIPSFEEG